MQLRDELDKQIAEELRAIMKKYSVDIIKVNYVAAVLYTEYSNEVALRCRAMDNLKITYNDILQAPFEEKHKYADAIKKEMERIRGLPR